MPSCLLLRPQMKKYNKMFSYKHTVDYSYSALTTIVTELGKATTEDQRDIVMEHWKTSSAIMDRSLHNTMNFVYAKSYDRKMSSIEKAIALDMKCLAKRLEAEKASLARCTELQSSLEALLE